MTVINEIFRFKKHFGWRAIMGEVFVLSQQGPWRSGLLDICLNPRSLPVLCSCHIFQLYFVKSCTKERSHKLFLKKKNGTYVSTKGTRELFWAEMSCPCGHDASIPSSRKTDSIACSQSTLMSYV